MSVFGLDENLNPNRPNTGRSSSVFLDARPKLTLTGGFRTGWTGWPLFVFSFFFFPLCKFISLPLLFSCSLSSLCVLSLLQALFFSSPNSLILSQFPPYSGTLLEITKMMTQLKSGTIGRLATHKDDDSDRRPHSEDD